MPVYAYRCDACETKFDRMLPLSQYDQPQTCPDCGEVGRKDYGSVGFILKGDDWAGKNIRIKNQMAKKNQRLDAKQNEIKRDAPTVTLAPNVNGERVDSWSDAQKLAASKGKNTASYEPMIRKEKESKS